LLLHVDVRRVTNRILETWQWIPSFVTPAFLLFLANFANSVSLDRIGISLTYTSKCGIPLMTVLLTLALEGRHALPSALALLSLVPIAAGIALANWSAPSFELVGFVAAIVSTTAQSALNVISKRVMSRTAVSGPTAQRCMVAVGLLLTLLVSAGQQVFRRRTTSKPLLGSAAASAPSLDRVERGHSSTDTLVSSKPNVALVSSPTPFPPAWLTILAFTSYHVEYLLSFMFVKLVQPITYGTLDAVRRLGIILIGRAMFGGAPLTWLNRAGIALALLGALGYSLATSG
jgi:solute carrier family 35 protein E1